MEHGWADIPGFGIIEPMGTRGIDPRSQEAVAKRLTALRQAFALPKSRFAKKCGISAQGLGNYELHGQMISIPMAHRICDSTDVDVNFLYQGTFGGVPEGLAERIREKLKHPEEPPRTRLSRKKQQLT